MDGSGVPAGGEVHVLRLFPTRIPYLVQSGVVSRCSRGCDVRHTCHGEVELSYDNSDFGMMMDAQKYEPTRKRLETAQSVKVARK